MHQPRRRPCLSGHPRHHGAGHRSESSQRAQILLGASEDEDLCEKARGPIQLVWSPRPGRLVTIALNLRSGRKFCWRNGPPTSPGLGCTRRGPVRRRGGQPTWSGRLALDDSSNSRRRKSLAAAPAVEQGRPGPVCAGCSASLRRLLAWAIETPGPTRGPSLATGPCMG